MLRPITRSRAQERHVDSTVYSSTNQQIETIGMEAWYHTLFNKNTYAGNYYREAISNNASYDHLKLLLEHDLFIINRSTVTVDEWKLFLKHLITYEKVWGLRVFLYDERVPRLNCHCRHIGLDIWWNRLQNKSAWCYIVHDAIRKSWKGYISLPNVWKWVDALVGKSQTPPVVPLVTGD